MTADLGVSHDQAWVAAAACRGKPTSWWFPARGDVFAAQVALTICRTCPVRCECLAEAVELEDVPYGIRGGLLPRQRHGLQSPTT